MRLLKSNSQQAHAPSVRKLAPWRFWTTIVTIVAFLSLLSVVSTHHHATPADDQDCAVCSVVSHKVGDAPVVALPALVLVLLSFAPYLPFAGCKAHIQPVLLPPSCGPPAAL